MTPPREPTLGRQLERAAEHPRVVRFIDRREQPTELSYGEILARAREVAAGLLRRGLRQGDRVAIILPTCPEFFFAFFGASLAGLVPVPLYPPVRLGRLDEYHRGTAEMLRACGARLVVTDGQVRRILGPTIERAGPGLACTTTGRLAEPGGNGPEAAGDGDALALIQFSSGTTGAPRPIRLTHRQVLSNAGLIVDRILESYPEGPGLTHHGVSWLPLYHDMGLVGCVFTSLLHAAELTLIPPELFLARPGIWLRTISRYRGTTSPAPNFAYALCADRIRDADLDGVDLSSWRLALNGAEPVSPATLKRFADRFAPFGLRPEALTPVYGLAEAALAVTFSPVREPFRWRRFDRDGLDSRGDAREAPDGEPLVELGRPLHGFELRVEDSSGGALPERRVGRIMVRGPSVMQGYHGLPRETARALRDGWLDTGDLGFLLDGRLYLYGRAKEIIILAGRNHAPQGFERALDGLPGVRPGCVAAVGAVTGDSEELVLLVERPRAPELQLPDDEVVRQVRSRIAERTGLVPGRVLVLDPGTLPRTSSGKIRRGEARRLMLAGELSPPRPVTPLRMARELLRSGIAFARARIAASRPAPRAAAIKPRG
jgi:acyl-CoA synthetase (AMP-forming)/AMP-acid ligase II